MQSSTQLVTGGNNSAASMERLREPGGWEASSWGWGRLPLGGAHKNSAAVPKRKQDPVIKEKGGSPCRRESWYKTSDKMSRLISEGLCECSVLHGKRAWSRASIDTRSPKNGDHRSDAGGPLCPFLAWGPRGQDRERLLPFLGSQGAKASLVNVTAGERWPGQRREWKLPEMCPASLGPSGWLRENSLWASCSLQGPSRETCSPGLT